MEHIIDLLSAQQTWEEFLTYRLLKGRFNWYEFEEADTYVSEQQYRDVVTRVQRGEPLSQGGDRRADQSGRGAQGLGDKCPSD